MPAPVPSVDAFLARQHSICVIGLGYVGLPLAVALATRFRVVGFDVNQRRIEELRQGNDRTRELSRAQLSASDLTYSTDASCLSEARFIIVTVPTPIDEHRRPDLDPLRSASKWIGSHIRPGTTVVFESTVYPGCTEEECIPIIERESGLRWKTDFFAGYSPERINPGDREHTVEKVPKIISGDGPETTDLIEAIYGAVITAGLHRAPTIRVAEAAKVIENTQRDLNIALMNEIALIFERQGINTADVLAAARTKWNFLPFQPGLVGGHCLGVDPYYLTFKAQSLGYHPEVILAGRRINDAMGKHVAEQTIKKLIQSDRPVKGARVLILGWTFKENVPDIRNTRVLDIHRELESYGIESLPFDPLADAEEVREKYGVTMVRALENHAPYDAIILAVRHKQLLADFPLDRLLAMGRNNRPAIIDVKSFFPSEAYQSAGIEWWQL